MTGEKRQQGESKADEPQKKKEEKGKISQKTGKKTETQRRLNACLNIGIGELFCSLIKGMILILLAS